MPMIYAITNQKGGVGKTTTCLCLAAALAELGKKVLMVDLDPQAGLTTSLGFDPESFETTTYHILIEERTILSCIVNTSVRDVCLVPANLNLAGAEAELIGELGWDRTLKDALASLESNSYDFILLDCPPSLGILTTNALVAADRAIIPVQAEYLALRALKQLQIIIDKVKRKGNPNLSARILRTMHSTRTLHTTEIVQELQRIFPGQLYKSVIKRTIKFPDSTLAGQSILTYDEKSDAAQAYRDLAQEVLRNG